MALKIHVTKIEAAEEGGLYGDLNIPPHPSQPPPLNSGRLVSFTVPLASTEVPLFSLSFLH
jgi:hypothetical protein